MYKPKRFHISISGLSADGRTNRWTASCLKCKKVFNPPTTMLSSQQISCPKCGEEEVIYYNEL